MNVVAQAAINAGGQAALARKINISPPAVCKWVKTGVIPAGRVIAVEKESGIPRQQLRPDIYPD